MSQKLRILLVDDDADDFVITRDLLAEIKSFHIELEWVDTYDLGLEAVAQHRHDVYLVDYRLGAHTGLDLLTEAIGINRKSPPIILLTGRDDREIDEQALNAGASDYLVKGQIDAALLERCIRYSLQQRRSLNALQKSEEKYRRIVEGTAALVITTDQHGKIFYVNETAQTVLGYDQAELLGTPFFQWVAPADRPNLESTLLEQVREKRQSCSTEFRYLTKAGRMGWFSCVSRLVERNEGAAELNSIIQDITEKKEAEEELADAHAREIETAVRIQDLLLIGSPPKDFPGLRLAAMSVASQNVAGDFTGFVRHAEATLDIIVGDVMGKGIPAALLAAATKNKLLHVLTVPASTNGEDPAPPSEIVNRLNNEICAQLIGLERFVTLCYARFDTGRKRLDFVDCGHTKTVHFRRSAEICTLEGTNVPLGFLENETYEQRSVDLAPGDVLVFYSDGVTEAKDKSGEFFGLTRLKDFVARFYFLSPEKLLQLLQLELIQFCGSEVFGDDLTCVIVKVDEKAQSILGRHAELEIRSEPRELARARLFIRQFCDDNFATDSESFVEETQQLELAVHEALANVMEHAYHKRTDGSIRLTVEARAQQIIVHLVHEGTPFTPGSVELPEIDAYAERGYGLYIINQYVDDVAYTRDASGANRISLTKRLH